MRMNTQLIENIRFIREKMLEMSRREFSEITGQSEAKIQNYEHNRQRIPRSFLTKLSEISGVPVEDIERKNLSIENVNMIVKIKEEPKPGASQIIEMLEKRIEHLEKMNELLVKALEKK